MTSTGETISRTVKNMLAIQVSEDRDGLARSNVRKVHLGKMNELADCLGISPTYLPKKIDSGTWNARDLDNLADFFSMWPVDFVPGPEDEKSE